ncbi:MFS transporter [Cereibacter azotoformans]|uniref:Putative MFS family arabinose efflux permease n=1 Tax=Cereibacter azotoformans TaxID=43057 RepID=A0A2T5KBG7_9RHOB|nr:MFS transporter [Cereibacter azotoformans]AXQ93766.1 MFS transporter [Cereibacter sphaeroides]MBO4168436.1 MFS transporter [Cereibacter azotoformans]PTR19751.1 putative MFS family arabinose efflux permease [Cereibacter azotoformans]UIJ29278.1 MFS transporter [Cereibacter azotoformans]
MIRSPMVQVFVLWFAGLGAAAQFSKVGVIFGPISDLYGGASEVTLGLVVSVVGFAGLIFGTTAGLLVARLGYRRVLVTALVAGAVLSLAEAMLPALPQMLVLRALEGVSHLAIVVAAPVLIAQIAPPSRQGFAMTLWSSFFAVAFAFTAWIGRPLVAAWGIPPLFLVHALYMAGCAMLVLAVLPADPKDRGAARAPAPLLRQHVEIYASARVAAPAIGFFCYTLVYVALLTLLPPETDHPAFLASAMPLASILLSLTLGVWMLGHLSAVTMVQGGFGLAILAVLGLWAGWGQDLPMQAAALALAAALGLVQGASFAAIPQLNPTGEDRARAAGAVAQLGNLGTTSGTPLLAALMAGQGPRGLILFVLLPCLAGILLHQWLSARRRATA